MKALKKHAYAPDYAVPPGETLQEVMESLGMTQRELAMRTGLTVQSLNRIFKGEQPISYDTAARLELVTGTPARFWNNLELNYQERLTAIQEQARLKEDLVWLKKMPTRELIKRGAMPAAAAGTELLRQTLRFYGVSSVAAWTELWERPAVAARRSPCFESQPGPASAWLRLGELQAGAQICKPYNEASFRELLPQIRTLTREKPEVYLTKLPELCAACGVAIAIIEGMDKVPWSGATRWLTPEKVMILLSLRGKGEDKFWFSFFHEACHVLHDSKKELLINDGGTADPRELRAEKFAADTLIPPDCDPIIRAAAGRPDIQLIADELEVSPAIIAGRYQHLTAKWSWFKDMIRPLSGADFVLAQA